MTPPGAVVLTHAQLARLQAAIIVRPGQTFVDRDGITRTTAPVIDHFVSSLARYHQKHGYLTVKQYAAIAKFVND